MSVKIGGMCLGAVQTNCYFVYDSDTKEAIVFDPPEDGERIYNALLSHGIKVEGICLTHGHFDHIMGVDELREKTGAKVYCSKKEEELLGSAELNAGANWGIHCTVKPDVLLEDGEELTIAGIKFKVIETPGHTKGSVCYYFEEDGILISGDTLFEGSCGRTDFPGGSAKEISNSLKNVLMKLPDDVQVYPGHGGSTTIGDERKYNPFC